MKKLSFAFISLAVILSNIMCAFVAYSYRGLICGIEHSGFSAPAWIAFLYAIPFVVCIIACVALAVRAYRRIK